MNEDSKPAINIKKLFPQVVRRMQILEHLMKSWPSVVGGAAARHSFPYDLIKNELYVAAENNHTAQLISNMKGNIARAFVNRYDYKENIDVKITIGRPHELKQKRKTVPVKINHSVKVNEDDVNKYVSECPDTMTSDAKFAISHLKAYLESINRI